jgi:hypothetical protein
LNEIIVQKDQHIEKLKDQIRDLEDKITASGNLMTGLKRKMKHIHERKEHFKNVWNQQVLESEKLSAKITDIRCEMAQLADELQRSQNPREVQQKPQTSQSYQDIAIDTSDLVRVSGTGHKRRRTKESLPMVSTELPTETSSSSPTSPIPEEVPSFVNIRSVDSALRQVVYELMQCPASQPQTQLPLDQRAEFKKFFWVYPKILSIFVNGLTTENPLAPFPDFEAVVMDSMTKLYQTRYLTGQMIQSLVQSSQILDAMDPLIALFNIFIHNEYDMLQYRFFVVLLDHSLGFTTPSLPLLIQTETLTAADTNLTIPVARAQQIYLDLFPFENEISGIFEESEIILFCEFIHLCIKKFDACRNHLWHVVKSGFCLSDCSDVSHISRSHFFSFIALTLPDCKSAEIRQLWTEISIRNRATGNDHPWLTFLDITFLVTHREAFFFAIMRIKTSPNFTAAFFDLDASMLKALAFIMNRLVYSVPALESQIVEVKVKIMTLAATLRGCLFMCDISGAFLQYRTMLHVVDGELVADGRTVMVSNRSAAAEVEALLGHFLDREKAIGLIQIEKQVREE